MNYEAAALTTQLPLLDLERKKSFLTIHSFFQMFERETRREKILEARNKELRLKEKTKGSQVKAINSSAK